MIDQPVPHAVIIDPADLQQQVHEPLLVGTARGILHEQVPGIETVYIADVATRVIATPQRALIGLEKGHH